MNKHTVEFGIMRHGSISSRIDGLCIDITTNASKCTGCDGAGSWTGTVCIPNLADHLPITVECGECGGSGRAPLPVAIGRIAAALEELQCVHADMSQYAEELAREAA